MGDRFRPRLSHHQALNLRIQILHILTHKMQVGIPVAYNVCVVKLDKINHRICVTEGIFSCDGIAMVLLHMHCKQLGSQLAFYESIYVSVFLN